MLVIGGLRGPRLDWCLAGFLLLTACLLLTPALLPSPSNCVSLNAFPSRVPEAAQPLDARTSTLQPKAHSRASNAVPLAFVGSSIGGLRGPAAAKLPFLFVSATPSALPAAAGSHQPSAKVPDAVEERSTAQTCHLEGGYCCSVSSTQRLPTRSVVVGGEAAGSEAFDLLHGQPAAVQQRLLQQKQQHQQQQQQQQQVGEEAGGGGVVLVGGAHRLAVQTMANSDTRDVEGTVQQVLRCAAGGADMVRLTVQGPREAEASRAIVDRLRELRCTVPLVADIHFQPRVASLCSDIFEKIRVNPGNFADGRKVWEEEPAAAAATSAASSSASADQEEAPAFTGLSPEEVGRSLGPWGSSEGLIGLLPLNERKVFCEGHRRIEEVFMPLVEKCLHRKRALRIGTNHGSLSARILRHFGDTPMGMVLSAIEFADICVRAGFYNFVFSLKSSNPRTMQHAYRLMAQLMAARGDLFPLHLGVTEAGEGEDGRIKSAAGIGALLQDGIGDTLRASLTEPPWVELPVCRFLRRMQELKVHHHANVHAAHPSSSASVIPTFTETTRNVATPGARRRLRLGLHPNAAGKPQQRQQQQSILHPDGTAVVAIDPEDLLEPASLCAALALRVVSGEPFRTLLSADAVYLRSLFFAPPDHKHPKQQQHQRTRKKQGDRHSQLVKGRAALAQLQRAGLTVWADAREIQQVQMTREQLQQQLLHQHAPPQQQQQMLHELEEASLFLPGMIAVQRLQDAAAIGMPLALEYLKETAGLALVADGRETLEEIQAVVGRQALLCVLVRPADRATSGVAAARRVSELLRRAERDWEEAGGPAESLGSIPILQWIEEPPLSLLAKGNKPRKQQESANADLQDDITQGQAMSMFAAWEGGSLLLDRLADGVLIDAPQILSVSQERQLALDLLQGCRMRSTKTEFISCPSCGRTLFDIQKVSAEIRRKTGHLAGVKIAVMGCIVNGIGEMGDADFGYVGGAPGLVDLYVGKKLVRRGVKSAEACDALVDVIKAEGRWKEPEDASLAS
ncbi:hypothetical protein ACSSS7_005070 [Eimeria intestinalis]